MSTVSKAIQMRIVHYCLEVMLNQGLAYRMEGMWRRMRRKSEEQKEISKPSVFPAQEQL